MSDTFVVGFLIYPNVTMLDFVGPAQILSQIPGAQVEIVWKDISPVTTDAQLTVTPTSNFSDCPQLDLICIPGGTGQAGIMEDEEVLAFVRSQGEKARYVTSVCSGSLLLAKAGLLNGYKATSHWIWTDDLAKLGAIPTSERVVIDRNRITGAGVTAGIDFALTVVSELLGPEVAMGMQLAIEYDPNPPFNCGSPRSAPAELTESIREGMRGLLTV